MSITVECGEGHTLRVKDALAGKRIRCPKCQSIIEVPDGDEDLDDFGPAEPAVRQRPPQREGQRSARPKPSKAKSSSSSAQAGLVVGGVVVAALLIGGGFLLLRKPARSSSSESAPVATVPQEDSKSNVVANGAAAKATAAANAAPQPAPNADGGRKMSREQIQAALKQMASKESAAAPPKETAATAPKPPETPAIPAAATPRNAESVIAVFDTAKPGEMARGNWMAVPAAAFKTHAFQGDCIVENGKLRLTLPRDAQPITLASIGESPVLLPIAVQSAGGKAALTGGISKVAELSPQLATIQVGGAQGGPSAAFRIARDKFWIEVLPAAKAEQLAIGVKSQVVVAPTRFGEDAICDSKVVQPGQTIAVPPGHMALALQCDTNTMAMLAYSSAEQAGTVQVVAGTDVSNHDKPLDRYVNSVSAKFSGKSVFVGLMPQTDNWFFIPVNKKYSASGQYPIEFKPAYPGDWRVAGRVNGKYFVSEIPHDHFMFACSLSGSFDFLLVYLNSSPSTDAATPLSIYQDTLGQSAHGAALVDAELPASAHGAPRKTKYRDVCNSVDDMKDVWRARRETLSAEPDYVKNLLGDCGFIIARMDRRLKEFESLGEHVAKANAELKQQGDAGSKTWQALMQKGQSKLKPFKSLGPEHAQRSIEKIEHSLAQPAKVNVGELDRTAESMRDVANHQEETLKKYRAAALELSEGCTKQLKPGATPPSPELLAVALHCRKVLRNRDPEE